MFACAPSLRHRRPGDRHVSAKCITMQRTPRTRSRTLVKERRVCILFFRLFSCLKTSLAVSRDFIPVNGARIIIRAGRKRCEATGSRFRVVDNKQLYDATDCQRLCAIGRVYPAFYRHSHKWK